MAEPTQAITCNIPRGERHRLKVELGKEEILLKSVKEKLLDQLHRLKVEELALEKYVSLLSNQQKSQTASATTGSYFANQTPNLIEANQVDQVNSIPLTGLNESFASNSLLNCIEYDDDEEEDDD